MDCVFLDCFNVYDHNGDGLISREEIFQQLKAAVVNVPPGEEQQDVAKDLVGEKIIGK